MDPNILIDALIFAIFSILKAKGKTDLEAKTAFHTRVDQLAQLGPLPSPAAER